MSTDLVFVATMPSLRVLAERCQRLALTVRSAAARQHLLALAEQMERQAGANVGAPSPRSNQQPG